MPNPPCGRASVELVSTSAPSASASAPINAAARRGARPEGHSRRTTDRLQHCHHLLDLQMDGWIRVRGPTDSKKYGHGPTWIKMEGHFGGNLEGSLDGKTNRDSMVKRESAANRQTGQVDKRQKGPGSWSKNASSACMPNWHAYLNMH